MSGLVVCPVRTSFLLFRHVWGVGFLRLLAVLAVAAFSHSLFAAAAPARSQQLTSPDQVPEGLAKSDWSSIRAAYEAGRHAFQPTPTGWQARNPGQQWTTFFWGHPLTGKRGRANRKCIH